MKGNDGMLRSPTFFVGAERQRKNLDEFQRREQQLAEAYHKNKPLCFNSRSYQKTHPVKAQKGHKDADACLTMPLVLGVADGVSQIEDFGIDASLLPNELLKVVQELGMYQLVPGAKLAPADAYRGPVSMLRRSFEATESLGSLTVVLAIMDNSTRIHGKLHPMIAIITVGDCELIVLRRVKGKMGPLEIVCHTEMQRIDGHAQTPLQLARVDGRIDPNFHVSLTIEVIERGSAVHCVSAYEGDIVIMGSDGVFDNLFLDELTEIANVMLPPGQKGNIPESFLGVIAQRIVEACHEKTRPGPNGQLLESPIGRGGKKDDTSCVVAEVIEWSEAHKRTWAVPESKSGWAGIFGRWIPLNLDSCCAAHGDSEDDEVDQPEPNPMAQYPPGGNASRDANSNGNHGSSAASSKAQQQQREQQLREQQQREEQLREQQLREQQQREQQQREQQKQLELQMQMQQQQQLQQQQMQNMFQMPQNQQSASSYQNPYGQQYGGYGGCSGCSGCTGGCGSYGGCSGCAGAYGACGPCGACGGYGTGLSGACGSSSYVPAAAPLPSYGGCPSGYGVGAYSNGYAGAPYRG